MNKYYTKTTWAAAAAALILWSSIGVNVLAAPISTTAPTVVSTVQQHTYRQGTTLATTFGAVRGTTEDNALVWKGIPYGKPPVGELRWRAPQDPAPWTGIRDAVTEEVVLQPAGKEVKGGENSLTLDVYRPNTADTQLPILFYIHGGNNQMGQAAEFDGSLFAEKYKVIVVAVNHRLDILGFNPLPALHTGNPEEDSGNYALLDLKKALDWTHDNAAALGGDSQNITISGFSAGGRDVLAILASPLFKNEFKQAISFSGGLTLTDPDKARQIYADKLAPLAVADHIKNNQADAAKWLLQDTPDVKKYLYSLPSDRLIRVFGNGNIRMAGFPHLFTDGLTLPKEGSQNKVWNDVPLILLDVDSEFSLFAVNDPYFAKAKTDGTLFTDPKEKSALDFTEKYGSALYRYANVDAAISALTPAYKAPIYHVRIDWGNDPSLVGADFANNWGAHHGIFLPLLTEKPVLTSKAFPTVYEEAGPKALSRTLQTYLANFIKTGNPNNKDLPHWKPYGKDGNGLALDADKSNVKIKTFQDKVSEQKILDKLAKDTSIPSDEKEAIIRKVLNGRWFSENLDKQFGNPDIWISK